MAQSDNFLLPTTDPEDPDSDAIVKGAIYGGLYNSQPVDSGLLYFCSAGNCTWDTCEIVGVCSKCQDVSSRFYLNCSLLLRVSFPPENYSVCSYMLPNNSALVAKQ